MRSFLSFSIIALVALLQYNKVAAQGFFFEHYQLQVQKNNLPMQNAWAGGLNAPQINTIDLNGDSQIDLCLMERTNNKVYTFLAYTQNNNTLYRYAPEYENCFPRLTYWAIMIDYDRDQRKDIFTYSEKGGIKVFRNTTLKGKKPTFELAYDLLSTEGFSNTNFNLLAPITDIPAITDLDDDGDVDIITFDFFTGAFAEFHQNQSMEKYGNANQLEFKKINSCWGDFQEGSACEDFTFQLGCTGSGGGGNETNKWLRTQHLGSTLYILDLNADNKKDLLLGDVSCRRIYSLLNEGTNKEAIFRTYQKDFPASHPIDLAIFPAVFMEDIDQDGKKDLLAAPNVFRNENNSIDFFQSLWYYKNTGTAQQPNFVFQQPNFLQENMIEVGENAAPAFLDYDADGDWDLIVANKGSVAQQNYTASLQLFENIGTPNNPIFNWKNDDFLQIKNKKWHSISLQIIDLNQDQKKDVLLSVTENNQAVSYYCLYENATTWQNPTWKLLPSPAELNDKPHWADMNGDGIIDLLLGKTQGNIRYYLNTETNLNPNLKLITDSLAGIQSHPFRRNVAPFIEDLDKDGTPDLIVADNEGKIKIYPAITKNSKPNPLTEWIADSLNQQYNTYQMGTFLSLATADLNADGLPEIAVGNNTGGIYLFKNTSQNAKTFAANENPQVVIYPNPTQQTLFIRTNLNATLQIYDAQGKTILKDIRIFKNIENAIPVEVWQSGIYIVHIELENGAVWSEKVMIQ
ncbi:MAG: T9SS C-terminal target domain-containing protein [Cytophagales bacterium]|nr:MAG: T9SS C-terminal target domain-containing protein [Cytophagales bacterium]